MLAIFLVFWLLTRRVFAPYCYSASYNYYYYSYYYCPTSYYYYHYYYDYYDSTTTNVGVIAGEVIGGIAGFIVFIVIIVAISCACKKSSGLRATIVQPAQPTVAVVQSSQQQQMGGYSHGYPQAYPGMQNPNHYPAAADIPPGYVEKV